MTEENSTATPPSIEEQAIQQQLMLGLQEQEVIFWKAKVASLSTQLAKTIHTNHLLTEKLNAEPKDAT